MNRLVGVSIILRCLSLDIDIDKLHQRFSHEVLKSGLSRFYCLFKIHSNVEKMNSDATMGLPLAFPSGGDVMVKMTAKMVLMK